MAVRELRVTDIRCVVCNAGPYQDCRVVGNVQRAHRALREPHFHRTEEFDGLVAEGWLWQEPDPTDKGSDRDSHERSRGG